MLAWRELDEYVLSEAERERERASERLLDVSEAFWAALRRFSRSRLPKSALPSTSMNWASPTMASGERCWRAPPAGWATGTASETAAVERSARIETDFMVCI